MYVPQSSNYIIIFMYIRSLLNVQMSLSHDPTNIHEFMFVRLLRFTTHCVLYTVLCIMKNILCDSS